MIRRQILSRMAAAFCLLLTLLSASPANAHVGSPDVFFSGMVGPWPARITIRMPGVVPGRAQILVQVQTTEPVTVGYVPLASRIAVSNAPPEEAAQAVPGESNVFTGELWLMTSGAYSIDVRVHGKSAHGAVQVPVDSVATAQLPLPTWLGELLAVLGAVLVFGAIFIIAAAAGEGSLAPDAVAGQQENRKYWIAATVTAMIITLALVGGRKWWRAEEKDFRSRLVEGGWPDMTADVRLEGSQRILDLTLGNKSFGRHEANDVLALQTDHGKLLHLYLVAESGRQAFAHIHPVRDGNNSFEVVVPPLPEGDYRMYCDLTLDSGFSSTATNTIHLPAAPANQSPGSHPLQADPDDSWAIDSAPIRENGGGDTQFVLPNGARMVWSRHSPLRARQDAGLQFQVRDQAGNSVHLEPYMGMMSHAAILRTDGRVFAHLHPSGNYSMAAQNFFATRVAQETGLTGGTLQRKVEEWCGPPPVNGDASIVSLPYEFPSSGDYRIFVQIKTESQVMTGVFDATVM